MMVWNMDDLLISNPVQESGQKANETKKEEITTMKKGFQKPKKPKLREGTFLERMTAA